MTRRWIITGASRGLGYITAKTAALKGDRVALVARRAVIHDIAKDFGPDVLAFEADVTDSKAMEQVADQVADAWGGIDVLVNNAGLHRGGKIERLADEDWNAVLETNLSGPFRMIRAVVPHMKTGGSIVNVGAVVGFRGFVGDSPYGASKAGLAGLTKVMAIELARRQIRVNLVVPGLVPTEMTAGISDKARETLIAKIPLGREGTDQEIADVIWWVAGSTYMTGSIIATDGGLSAGI